MDFRSGFVRFILENFTVVMGLLKEYGDFWRLWTGPELNFIVQDPNDVEVKSLLFHCFTVNERKCFEI